MTTDHMELRMAAAGPSQKAVITRTNLVALLDEFDTLRAQVAAAPKRKAKKVASSAPTLPGWMPIEAWEAFLAMRVKIKKPATDYAQKLLIKKLTDFIGAGMDPQAVLEQSITSGWQDLYALRGQQQASGRRNTLTTLEQVAANSAEALRLLGQPVFADDGMTIEAAP